MRISIQMLLVTLAMIVLVGCRNTGPGNTSRQLAELRIESHPKGWGYAHKTVKTDGTITGGHLSGGAAAPRVFESKSKVSSQDMSALRALVATIAAEKTNDDSSCPDQNLDGYTSVVIISSDGTTTTAFAKWGQQFHSKAIQTIWETMSKYQVGAW